MANVSNSPVLPLDETGDGSYMNLFNIKTILLSLFLGACILVGTLGNLLVVVAILTDRHLKKRSNYFLVSLGFADLLVCLLIMSVATINEIFSYWPMGLALCKVWIAADITCSTGSILNLCSISIDRFVNIKRPLHYESLMTIRVVAFLIVLSWIISVMLSSVPVAFGIHRRADQSDLGDIWYNQSEPICGLEINPAYAIISSSISFFIPCIVMIVIYYRLYALARHHVKAIAKESMTAGLSREELNHTRERQLSLERNSNSPTINATTAPYLAKKRYYKLRLTEYKALITLGIIMGVFILCWLPFFVTNIINAIQPSLVSPSLFGVLTWLGYANSVVNPFIYSIFNLQFRRAFKKIIKRYVCCCCCPEHSQFFYATSRYETSRGDFLMTPGEKV